MSFVYSIRYTLYFSLISGLTGCASVIEPELPYGEHISEIVGFNEIAYQKVKSRIMEYGGEEENLAFVDFSQPSELERLYVVNLRTDRVIKRSLVSHAKNSGYRRALEFSNVKGSKMSSLGLYQADNTYDGKNGYSLRIDGLDIGLNENARERFIVVHGSDYASYEYIELNGMLGRLDGCFAIPFEKHVSIIDSIKDGGYIFAID